SSPAGQFVSIDVARDLLQKAGAAPEWNLTAERFRRLLERSVAHRFAKAPRGAPSSSSAESIASSNSVRDSASHPTLSASSGAHPNAGSNAVPGARAIHAYLDSLHAADLALACACSEGNAAAWDFSWPDSVRSCITRAERSREKRRGASWRILCTRNCTDCEKWRGSGNRCSIIF